MPTMRTDEILILPHFHTWVCMCERVIEKQEEGGKERGGEGGGKGRGKEGGGRRGSIWKKVR